MTGKHRYLLRVRGEDFALRLEVESREEVEKRLSEESFARVLPTQYFLEYLDEEENCYVRVLKADELPEGGHLRVSPLYGLDQPPPPYYPPLDKSVLDTTPGRIYQYFGEPHLPMYMSPPTPKYVTPPAPPYVSPPAPPGAPTSLNIPREGSTDGRRLSTTPTTNLQQPDHAVPLGNESNGHRRIRRMGNRDLHQTDHPDQIIPREDSADSRRTYQRSTSEFHQSDDVVSPIPREGSTDGRRLSPAPTTNLQQLDRAHTFTPRNESNGHRRIRRMGNKDLQQTDHPDQIIPREDSVDSRRTNRRSTYEFHQSDDVVSSVPREDSAPDRRIGRTSTPNIHQSDNPIRLISFEGIADGRRVSRMPTPAPQPGPAVRPESSSSDSDSDSDLDLEQDKDSGSDSGSDSSNQQPSRSLHLLRRTRRIRPGAGSGISGRSGKKYGKLSEMVKKEMATKYEAGKEGIPTIYKLKKRKIMSYPEKQIAKYDVGERVREDIEEKVLMLVGATGAGKTTMINGIVNYVYGVEWDDDFRFKLITERKTQETTEASARSQTKHVTAYTLHWQTGFQVPYSLTIIDTPGFGDTEGLDLDRGMLTKVHSFFAACKRYGLDSLNGVGLVLPASVSRLTGAQTYIFGSVMELFGKDVGDKFYVLVSFADGQRPKVLNTLKAAKIPHDKSYRFNNSALFSANTIDEGFQFMFWDMGTKSYSTFLDVFKSSDPVPLKKTMDVLEDRQRLQDIMQRLESEIRRGLTKLEELRETYESVKTSRNTLDKFKVTRMKYESIPLNNGEYAINCCNSKCTGRTCQYPSDVTDRELQLSQCMRSRTTTGYARCIHCNCAYHHHANQNWRYEATVVTELSSEAEIRSQYEKTLRKSLYKEELTKNLAADIRSCQLQVYSMISDAHMIMNQLQENALRPEPVSTVDYINLLIEAEKREAKRGYLIRIQQLEAVKRASQLAEDLLRGQHNPFPNLRETLESVQLLDLGDTGNIGAPDSLVDTIRGFLTRAVKKLKKNEEKKHKDKKKRLGFFKTK